MNPEELNCWKCGVSLKDVLLPLARLSKCKSCNVDLHVCRMCEFYDTTVNNSCREPIADKVTHKNKNNFCGYFQPSKTAYKALDTTQATSSQQQLDALFGLDAGNVGEGQSGSADDEARRKLDDLFNLNNKD
jgi:hypothetical protein